MQPSDFFLVMNCFWKGRSIIQLCSSRAAYYRSLFIFSLAFSKRPNAIMHHPKHLGRRDLGSPKKEFGEELVNSILDPCPLPFSSKINLERRGIMTWLDGVEHWHTFHIIRQVGNLQEISLKIQDVTLTDRTCQQKLNLNIWCWERRSCSLQNILLDTFNQFCCNRYSWVSTKHLAPNNAILRS